MAFRLEHANLGVRDIEAMIRFLQIACPEFRVRGEGTSRDGTRWVHVGTNDTYIALGQATADSGRHWVPYAGEPGVNHLAYEVDEVDSLQLGIPLTHPTTRSCGGRTHAAQPALLGGAAGESKGHPNRCK